MGWSFLVALLQNIWLLFSSYETLSLEVLSQTDSPRCIPHRCRMVLEIFHYPQYAPTFLTRNHASAFLIVSVAVIVIVAAAVTDAVIAIMTAVATVTSTVSVTLPRTVSVTLAVTVTLTSVIVTVKK